MLADAERPVLYAGGGVLSAHATPELRALADYNKAQAALAKSEGTTLDKLNLGWEFK